MAKRIDKTDLYSSLSEAQTAAEEVAQTIADMMGRLDDEGRDAYEEVQAEVADIKARLQGAIEDLDAAESCED